jgi:hypothetical protein
MVKYTKKVDEKISNLIEAVFHKKHKKVIRFKFYLNIILKLLSPQLGLLQINYKISKNLE